MKPRSFIACAGAGFGESTTDLAWDGHGMICENGTRLAESERFAYRSQVVFGDLDLDRIAQDRMRLSTFGQAAERYRELLACAGRVDRTQALAARLAGKEAFLKALGTGWIQGLSFRQVEIVKGNGGGPGIELSGGAAARARERGVTRSHVSLSHERDYAAAVVVLEG